MAFHKLLSPATLLLTFALAASSVPVRAGDETLFPFVVSYDSPANVTNVSGWLARPAGSQGFIGAADGHLTTTAGPIRLWATNMCFEACFPTHEQAERVAARLARLGINCVRMHHMDSHPIWGKSPNKLTIDPEKLEKLDYLIYQLKLNGVYTNLNLHVSRWFDKAEGFTHRDERPKYDKGLDNFEPRMIELQKKYARDLLAHVNPYIKTAYTDEPAVAVVEINNENALHSTWNSGGLDSLPDPYATTFRRLWNDWLKKKYQDTSRLTKAWSVGQESLGEEMLRDQDFVGPIGKSWVIERDKTTQADVSVQPGPKEGGKLLRIVVKKQGDESWRPQLIQSGFPVKKDRAYTLSFDYRSDRDQRPTANCGMGHSPWGNLGLAAPFAAGPKWQRFTFTFVALADDANARISFSRLEAGTHEIAAVSLRPGGVLGVEAGQRLEDNSVPVVAKRSRSVTRQARQDFADFMWDTEHDYWLGMYRFLKDELKVRSLVSGTQLGYGPTHVQAQLDYIDNHAYWEHPHFPGRPWDPKDWTVKNVALVNSPGGTLTRLAAARVAGMPYTVSEYNHPAPNMYAAEGFPMIAAFAAFQGWDGVFSFAYCHNDKFEPQQIGSYFDINGHPAKLVHMPACAALFLRGDVAPAKQTLWAPMPAEAERATLRETLNPRSLNCETFGVESRQGLMHAIGVALKGDLLKQAATPPPAIPSEATEFVADTGQLRWDVSKKGAGYFTADTPRSKLFTGFAAGRTFPLGNVTLQIGPTRLDWATVSLVCLDGQGFDQPGKILVAATGWVMNQGAELEKLEGDKVTLRNKWGSAPVMCEGIPAEVTLPVTSDRVTFYPLDEAGNRRAAVPAQSRDGRCVLPLGPKHQTLWYEVEVR